MNLRSEIEGSSNPDRMLPLLAVTCPNPTINQIHYNAQIRACKCSIGNTGNDG